MKKLLSLTLALCIALTMVASFALIVDTTPVNSDPFVLSSIKVTDVAGYNAPYSAVDSAATYVANQTAYVVVGFQIGAIDASKGIVALNTTAAHEITVTSSTLDMTYAASTVKAFSVLSTGAIAPIPAVGVTAAADKVVIASNADAMGFSQPATGVNQYFYAFIAITKPATAGAVKAAFKVSPTEFVGDATTTTLNVFDSTGLKYVIDRTIDAANGDTYTVSTMSGTTKTELFGYKNTAGNASFAYISKGGVQTNLDYFGHITYQNGTTTVDITSTVNAVNAFFGFSFVNTTYPVKDVHFTAKTIGNPIVVTDTYSYVNADVNVDDDDVIIAPTGDFSANIAIAFASSAVLAAAALLFVAKKARD